MTTDKPTGLIYVTGVGGTGKSSLQKRFEERGFNSVDADHGYCAFYNRQTGAAIVGPPRTIRTPDWLAAHEWRFIPAKFNELRKRSQRELLFLCGTAKDEAAYQSDFAKVFALKVDDDTLRQRLRGRAGENAYGKSDHELELTLEENHESHDRYTALGAIFIDATQPLDAIIDKMLQTMAT